MTDLACDPHITNGNGSSSGIVEMGAYEFVPVVLSAQESQLEVILNTSGLDFGVRPPGRERVH